MRRSTSRLLGAVLDRGNRVSGDAPSVVAEFVSETPRPTLTATVPLQLRNAITACSMSPARHNPAQLCERELLTLLAPFGGCDRKRAPARSEVEAAQLTVSG